VESYDVIIGIGRRPAGLKCAEKLAGTNLKVLLLEKNKILMFPRANIKPAQLTMISEVGNSIIFF
jgi:flavin-dependent dehydrogenase